MFTNEESEEEQNSEQMFTNEEAEEEQNSEMSNEDSEFENQEESHQTPIDIQEDQFTNQDISGNDSAIVDSTNSTTLMKNVCSINSIPSMIGMNQGQSSTFSNNYNQNNPNLSSQLSTVIIPPNPNINLDDNKNNVNYCI